MQGARLQEADLSTREILERLRRWASRLETGAALLRAEIETLARRFAAPDPIAGHRLGFGLDKLFRLGELDPRKPVAAYQRLLDAFYLAFEAGEDRPEIFVWQSRTAEGGTDGDEGRHGGRRAILNIDIREKPASAWVLLEIELSWETLRAHPRFDLCLQGRATSTCDLGANLYYIDRAEGAKQTAYRPFVLREELQVETIPMQLLASDIEAADEAQPPKIFLHLSNVEQTRIEIHALEAVEPSRADA